MNRIRIFQLFLLTCFSAWVAFSGCSRGPAKEDNYRKDEAALLKLTAEDILSLESRKQYDSIYDTYFSANFKRTVPRRRFLMMSNCLERYLGDFVGFEHRELVFHRKKEKKDRIDSVTLTIYRAGGTLKEHFDFIREGLDFRLLGLYWSTSRQDFIRCIETAEKAPAEEPEAVKEESAQKDSAETPLQEGTPREPQGKPTVEQPSKNTAPPVQKANIGIPKPAIGVSPSPSSQELQNKEPPPREAPNPPLPDAGSHNTYKGATEEHSSGNEPAAQGGASPPVPQSRP